MWYGEGVIACAAGESVKEIGIGLLLARREASWP